jgi:hypothetical protein
MNNNNWIVFVVVVLAILSSCRKAAQKPSQTRSAFAAKIEAVLPTNWSLEENGQEVMIARKQPIIRWTCVALDLSLLQDPDRFEQYVKIHGLTDTYKIRLRRTPAIDMSEYQRQKAINAQIKVTKSTPVPDRTFLEDDAIRSYDSRYRELPEYYDDSSSIYFQTNLGPYECIHPNEVARECESIRQKLDSLFRRYATDDTPRALSRGLGPEPPKPH